MKFFLNEQDLIRLEKLIAIKDDNIAISNILYSLFDHKKMEKLDNINHYFNLNIVNFISHNDDLSNEEYDLLNKCIKSNLKLLKTKDYLSNPYFRKVKIKPIKIGDYQLKYLSYAPYELFSYDDISIEDNSFYEINKVGYFSKAFHYPSLSYKNNVWMCITPNEIKTMEKHISLAKGNVLVGGLGLGYFPFMISLKRNVKSITIIESDSTIISMFKKEILPKFKNKEKINIIHSDLFDYLNSNKEIYDYCFHDIWHSPEDGLPLLIKLLKYENPSIYKEVTYWLDTSLLAYYRRFIIEYFNEQLRGFDDKKYVNSKDFIDQIFYYLHHVYKNTAVNSYHDILKILSEENIKKLLRDFVI